MPAQSAPLAAIQLDYRRYSAIAQNSTLDRDTRRLVEGLGLMTMQLVADERGLVVWSSFEFGCLFARAAQGIIASGRPVNHFDFHAALVSPP